jgi:5-methylcytosine-specific restriction enzyme A
MSHNRLNPKRGWCNPSVLPKGPNGRALCRECGKEVPTRRNTFCSNACVESWKIRSQPSYVRHLLYKRDAAVCAICGVSCKLLVRELEKLDDYYQDHQYKSGWGWDYEDHIRANGRLMAKLEVLGISVHRYLHRKRWGIWDADHIVAVCEGGGESGLDNFRTLCCRCHRTETAALRRRRLSKSRVVPVQTELPLGSPRGTAELPGRPSRPRGSRPGRGRRGRPSGGTPGAPCRA